MKKYFWIRAYKFSKPLMLDRLKYCTKYGLEITIFKYTIRFRIMNQDNSFFFRCENLNMWLADLKYRRKYKSGELPF